MKVNSKSYALLVGALIGTAGVLTAQASSTIITFSVDMGANIANSTFVPGTDTISVHGTFNGWGTGVNLIQDTSGSGTVYTNTVNDASDVNGGVVKYKFVNSNAAFNGSGGYENLCDGGGNRCAVLPSVSGSSLILPTPFYADSGATVTFTSTITFQVDMSQQINLGLFANGVDTAYVVGNFNGWSIAGNPLTRDTSILVTNQPSGIVTSNVYTGTFTSAAVSTNAHMAYQFGINGNYVDSPQGDNNDGGGNRFFTMLPNNQTLPVVFIKDAPFSLLVASNITFSVDMSIVALTDTNFNPGSVTVNGDLMGWGGVAMTNNPNAANTNIYTSVGAYFDTVGQPVNYQYRYTELTDGSTVYDHYNGANGGNNNRLYTVANVPSTNVLSVFNDATLNDYLTRPTPVTFFVNMNGAVGTDSHVFDGNGGDRVYINGQFANWYAWASGVNPADAPSQDYLMTENPPGSGIYSNTLTIPAGTPVAFNYKYGIAISGSGYNGPADDEAVSGSNHYRVVRASALNPYVMAADKFGNQYGEPFFNNGNTGAGNLRVGAPVAGKVPVTWLGRPGALLQVKDSLTSGAWLTIPATDGTNWTTGYSSTNGFVSQTNWPATSTKFFRLVKP
ncbi:MAG TPA: hypothetical protein VNN22_04565 [Verrucomicrobiae bacterium]|nr:hypothetical protein [Verrucomicrobiae bacterium]